MKDKLFIASDFDGTIDCGEEKQKDIDAILRWRKAGNIFTVISGRNTPQIRKLIDYYGFSPDYVMGDSGNACYTTDGELVFSNPVDAKYVKPLCHAMLEMGASYICVDQPDYAEIVYHDRKGKGENIPFDEAKLEKFKTFTQTSGVFASGHAAQDAADYINEKFEGNLLALRNGACLDVVPENRSKAVCTYEFTRKLGIDEKNIFCIGDNYNDIPMLDRYNSFVVENGPDEVKKHAKVAVVKSVADMIEYLLTKY